MKPLLAKKKEPVTTETGEATGQRMLCLEDFKDAADGKLPPVYRSKWKKWEARLVAGSALGSAQQSADGASQTTSTTAPPSRSRCGRTPPQFRKYRIRPRVLIDVSRCSPAVECLDREVAFPVGIGPAVQFVAHPDA
jgi:hypothetical protein